MYNIIKSRMAALGLKSVDMVKLINNRYAEHVNPQQFSDAIRASYRQPRQEHLIKLVETILAEEETKGAEDKTDDEHAE